MYKDLLVEFEKLASVLPKDELDKVADGVLDRINIIIGKEAQPTLSDDEILAWGRQNNLISPLSRVKQYKDMEADAWTELNKLKAEKGIDLFSDSSLDVLDEREYQDMYNNMQTSVENKVYPQILREYKPILDSNPDILEEIRRHEAARTTNLGPAAVIGGVLAAGALSALGRAISRKGIPIGNKNFNNKVSAGAQGNDDVLAKSKGFKFTGPDAYSDTGSTITDVFGVQDVSNYWRTQMPELKRSIDKSNEAIANLKQSREKLEKVLSNIPKS